MRRTRVFIGLTEVAGYYRGLEQGLREIGVDARFFDLSGNPFRYGARPGAAPARSRPSYRRYAVTDLRFWLGGSARAWSRAWLAVRRAVLLPWAVLRYDVFVFSGMDSFLGYRDLPLLRHLGKRVVYVFNGTDHRPPYLNGKRVREIDRLGAAWLVRQTRTTSKRVRTIEAHASVIVALSASAQFHTRPFVHFLALGLPYEGVASRPRVTERRSDQAAVRVVHCPTDVQSKGTPEVRAAIARLRENGHAVDYREVIGRPNADVLNELEVCDVVVDEVYSDTPMAGLATEAAWFAKPTLVTGYYAAEVESDLSAEMIPPTAFRPPGDLERELERLITDPAHRSELGHRARVFVEERWPARLVAERFLAVIDGRAPEAWQYDPARLRYVHGWGMPEELVCRGLRAVIDEAGVDALGLGHNPILQARAVALSGSTLASSTQSVPSTP